MVMFDVADTMAFLGAIRERGLLINPVAEGRFRAVTHLDVSEHDIEEALAIIEDAARGASR
jgi:threonine aldolase